MFKLSVTIQKEGGEEWDPVLKSDRMPSQVGLYNLFSLSFFHSNVTKGTEKNDVLFNT